MANPLPIARLTVSATSITMPDKIQWSLADSRDINNKGEEVERAFKYTLKVNGVLKSTQVSGELELQEGENILEGSVTDLRGGQGFVTIIVTVKPAIVIPPPVIDTEWGIKVVGLKVDEQIEVAKKMGVTCLRTSVEIENYTGQNIKFIDDCYNAGVKTIVNINWQAAGSQRLFPTDIVKYKAQLRKFLDKYAEKIEVGVCENEPSVDKFYVSDKVAYINELRAFVEVCNEYGMACTDGAIFVEVVAAMADGKTLPGYNGWEEVVYFVDAFKTIPLTYVNFHTEGTGNSYPAGQFKKAADYIRATTGHDVMSNEVHTDNGTPALVTNIVGQVKEAGFAYFMIWGGGGDGGDPFNTGTDLTPMGVAYADAIK